MKKTIIVGASFGIGKELAKVLAANGYTIGDSKKRRTFVDPLRRALFGQKHQWA